MGSVVVAHGLSCCAGIFKDQRVEPVFPALAGKFLTSGPAGKESTVFVCRVPCID